MKSNGIHRQCILKYIKMFILNLSTERPGEKHDFLYNDHNGKQKIYNC